MFEEKACSHEKENGDLGVRPNDVSCEAITGLSNRFLAGDDSSVVICCYQFLFAIEKLILAVLVIDILLVVLSHRSLYQNA